MMIKYNLLMTREEELFESEIKREDKGNEGDE